MSSSLKSNILFITGGTGGHIYPALSVYSLLKSFKKNIFFATDQRGLYFDEVSALKPFLINIQGYEGKTFLKKIASLIFLVIGVFKSILFIKKNDIKIIVGFGSYVQVPFVFAALILKKNVILHEGNVVMGKANRLFWRYVKVRTSAFKLKEIYSKTIHIGMPVRDSILSLYQNSYEPVTKKGVLNLLVLGGSQGSKLLSYKLCKCLVKLPEDLKKRINIFHQARIEDLSIVRQTYKNNNIKSQVKYFFNDINMKIKKAGLVISRAGASTIYENAIAGKPAIYFPINNSIGNHQYKNALVFKNNKAAWIFGENDIDNGFFLKSLIDIINDKNLLRKFSKNKKNISKPDAAKKFKEIIMKLGNSNV